MRAAGQDTPNSLQQELPVDTRVLRLRLIREEVVELAEAMGFATTAADAPIDPSDLPMVADGLADLMYVVIGCAVAYGINLGPVWAAVHTSNMEKFGPGSYRREDGKWVKPPNWVHPNLEGVLQAQLDLARILQTYSGHEPNH